MKGLSVSAKAYVLSVLAFGVAANVWAFWSLFVGTEAAELWLLFGAAVVGAAAQVRMVAGPTSQSSYHLGLVALGFILVALGPAAAVVASLTICLVEWVWHRFERVSQLFNISSLSLSLLISGLVRAGVASIDSDAAIVRSASLLAAVGTFVFVNHLLVGGVIRLNRGESFSESGVFVPLTLLIDATLVGVGMCAALLWPVNPYAASLLLLPLYLVYHSLKMPALERQASTDAKTALFNARYFREALERELNRANRFDRPLTVVIADLDLLRNINNLYGHMAGDVVLVGVARILKESVREYDVVCRFGGEEFAIVMPEVSLTQAMSRVEACRASIADSVFEAGTGVQIRATMSFGIAERRGPGQDADDILHRADLALYRAKLEGRNRVCSAPEDHPAWGGASPIDTAEDAAAEAVPGGHWIPSARAEDPAGSTSNGDGSVPAASVGASTSPGVSGGASVASAATVGASLGHAPSEPASAPEGTDRSTSAGANPWLRIFVAGVAVIAAVAFALGVPGMVPPDAAGVTGLLIFVALTIAAELLSLDIYGREASVSLSGAPFVAGVLLFGPVGALVLGGALAASAMVKNRSPVNRFVFNSSIHLLAGLACLGAARTVGFDPGLTGPWLELALSVVSALFLYVVTTGLLSVAIGLSARKNGWHAWCENFRWLAPYYVALGVLAYALLFGYTKAGPAGLVIAVVPAIIVRIGQKQYMARTKSLVTRLEEVVSDLKLRTREVSRLNEELLVALGNAVDARDPDVIGHSRHVARYAVLIARELNLSRERVNLVRRAGLLHDIGKLGIPESILFKPERLSEAEYAIVKRHSALGGEILSSSDPLRSLVAIVRHHHERWDGGGYPDGLAGSAIPLESRILAVADAVEAMASDRPYSAASDVAAIVTEIESHAGTQFDPNVVAAFSRAVNSAPTDLVVNSAAGRA